MGGCNKAEACRSKEQGKSKESSNSESDGGTPSIHEPAPTQRLEKTMSRLSAGSDVRGERRTVAASESRSLAGDCRVASSSVDSPTQRRARMAKSLSQDTGCCITEPAPASLPSSTSDSALNNKVAAAPSPLLPYLHTCAPSPSLTSSLRLRRVAVPQIQAPAQT